MKYHIHWSVVSNIYWSGFIAASQHKHINFHKAEAICRQSCVLYLNYQHDTVVKNYYLLLLSNIVLGGTSYFFNFSDW